MAKRIPVSPNDFDEERIEHGLTDFRCEKCQGRYPRRLLVIQDGRRLCKPNCAYTYSPSETQVIAAQASVIAADLYASTVSQAMSELGQAPVGSLMTGVSALLDIKSPTTAYPDMIPLSPGGASVVMTGVGFNFQSTDTIVFNTVHITLTTPVISTDLTTFTTTIAADSLCQRGNYDLLFNGGIWRNVVMVR